MSQEFDALCRTIRKLRSPEGCPWDRKQTPESLRPCLIEECFETVNAIDANDIPNIREELGDIFLNTRVWKSLIQAISASVSRDLSIAEREMGTSVKVSKQ